jgi:hypothetical protein
MTTSSSRATFLRCPGCKAHYTEDELDSHTEKNIKIIDEEAGLEYDLNADDHMAAGYDRERYVEEVVMCPKCNEMGHYEYWLKEE